MKDKLKAIFSNLDLILTGIVLCFMVGLTFISVFMRYVFLRPIMWLEEAQLWCMVWLVYLGAGAVYRNGGHIAIDILVDAFPKKLQRIVTTAGYIFMCILLLYLMIQGWQLVAQMMRTGRATSYTKVPYALIYSAVPVGCLLMVYNMIAEIYRTWKHDKNGEHPDIDEKEDI